MARRRNGIIDKLPGDLKEAVDQMLLSGDTYSEVVEFLRQNTVPISQMSVHRYAQYFLATVEQLKMAQESMQMLMSEMDKYPNLDTSEAILRVASQNVFNAINAVPQEQWEGVDPIKLLNQATGLIRAAGNKRKTDAQLKTDKEAALEANQTLLFDVLAKSHPELYEQVAKAVSAEKRIQEEA